MLKKVESTGAVKVKITGNGFKMTPEEKQKFLKQTGLKDHEVIVDLITTTTEKITEQIWTSTDKTSNVDKDSSIKDSAGGETYLK